MMSGKTAKNAPIVTHKVRGRDGSLRSFTAIPVMSLDEMKEAGAVNMSDPKFVAEQAAAAIERAQSRGQAEGGAE